MPARATVAGYQVAAGTIESAHLMYQNRTALNFLMGVKRVIDREVRERKAALVQKILGKGSAAKKEKEDEK